MTDAHTAGWRLHRIGVPGGTLAVAEYRGVRARGAEPLVLLHGFTGSHRSWDAVVPALASLTPCFAVDLPGHGESEFAADVEACSMERTSLALEAGLDALRASSVTLVGYSMGGRLALYFALTRPARVRRLVLESASPGLATAAERAARRQADEELACLAEDQGIDAFVDRWESVPVLRTEHRLPATTRARLRRERLRCTPTGLALSLRGMGTGRQPWLGDRLENVVMPTLLIAGSDDLKFVELAQSMSRRVPDAAVAIVSGAGHNVHLERETEFVRLVGRFVSCQTARAAAQREEGEGPWQSPGER